MSSIRVLDGEMEWFASASSLRAALHALGWTINGERVIEPHTDDDEPGAAYAALCNEVTAMDYPGEITHEFVARPDWGADMWQLSRVDA